MEVLATTQQQFESIHEALDGSRANAKSIKLPYQAVMNLLMDHSTMFKLLGHTKVVSEKD